MQLAGRGGQLVLGCLNELLIAAVEQPRHLEPHQDSGVFGESSGAGEGVVGWHQDRSRTILAHQLPAGNPGERGNLECMRAECVNNLVKVGRAGFLGIIESLCLGYSRMRL